MPRVVPSQIVEFVDERFPFARSRQEYIVDDQFKGSVSALLRLVDKLPDELLMLDGVDYSRFILSISTVESTLEAWNTNLQPGALHPAALRELCSAISNLRACLELRIPGEVGHRFRNEVGH
jgi:hypothetical protein